MDNQKGAALPRPTIPKVARASQDCCCSARLPKTTANLHRTGPIPIELDSNKIPTVVSYSIVTGFSALTTTSGTIIPAGQMSDATGLSSAPAGVVVNLVFQSITSVNNHTAKPALEIYRNNPYDTPANDLIPDLLIPLR